MESFSLTCADWQGLLTHPSMVETLEAELLSRLENPVRLLRWAIVSVDLETQAYRCEGAYLKAAAA